MPKAKDIDWDVVQTLYLQGVRPVTIARQFGVTSNLINLRASRDGWTAILRKTREKTGERLEEMIQNVSSTAKTAFAQRLLHLSQSLPARTLAMDKELDIQSRLEPAIRNAKVVLGWGEGGRDSVVRIAVIGQSMLSSAGQGGEGGVGPLSRAESRVDGPSENFPPSEPSSSPSGNFPILELPPPPSSKSPVEVPQSSPSERKEG